MQKVHAVAEVRLVFKLKIVSWNVNSLRAREPIVEKLIKKENPDILCIQELKINDKEYVFNFFSSFGYSTFSQTQKSYNGVSFSNKKNIKVKDITFSNLNVEQARNNTILLDDYNIVIINNYFPKGFIKSIKDGNKVKTDTIANNIARPVKIPK